MRRRNFLPCLEGLDMRIVPSGSSGLDPMAATTYPSNTGIDPMSCTTYPSATTTTTTTLTSTDTSLLTQATPVTQ